MKRELTPVTVLECDGQRRESGLPGFSWPSNRSRLRFAPCPGASIPPNDVGSQCDAEPDSQAAFSNDYPGDRAAPNIQRSSRVIPLFPRGRFRCLSRSVIAPAYARTVLRKLRGFERYVAAFCDRSVSHQRPLRDSLRAELSLEGQACWNLACSGS